MQLMLEHPEPNAEKMRDRDDKESEARKEEENDIPRSLYQDSRKNTGACPT